MSVVCSAKVRVVGTQLVAEVVVEKLSRALMVTDVQGTPLHAGIQGTTLPNAGIQGTLKEVPHKTPMGVVEVAQTGVRIFSESMAKRSNVKTTATKAKRHKGLEMEGPKVELVEVLEGTFVLRWDVHVRDSTLHDTGVAKQLLTGGVLPLDGDHITPMSKEEFKAFFQSPTMVSPCFWLSVLSF
ncbi:hypothetical protein NE237_029895 [Protea cynaroides]|uniref:Uncharacterized protein n=1 Tax=Protea cynaroides TaxID=273540 RepID=A0A9Q0GUR8_9MAGN|nr:hypothetical protein NE237_029895 [Protea cynaroides]